MLFNAILTLPRKKNLSAASLWHRYAIDHGQALDILKVALAVAVFLAIAAAGTGVLDMLLFQGTAPYGMSGMERVNQFIGSGLPTGF